MMYVVTGQIVPFPWQAMLEKALRTDSTFDQTGNTVKAICVSPAETSFGSSIMATMHRSCVLVGGRRSDLQQRRCGNIQ